MYGLNIEIKDNASPELLALAQKLNPESINPLVGRAGVNIVRNHLFEVNDARPNKLGGKRTNFFAAAARSANFREESDGVTVSINQVGIGLQYFGGTIKPQNSKALTIPAIAEAHGKRAGEIPHLKLVWPKGANRGWLEQEEHTVSKTTRDRRKGHEGELRVKTRKVLGGKIFFWLVAKAAIQGDRSILPSESLIMDSARSAILNALRAKYSGYYGGAS